MNIKYLQLFIHLCDSKNFSKTAAAMHISPSALSRQIQRLEEEVGQSLFIRDNRSVELTSTGKKLLPIALNMTSEWGKFKSDIAEPTLQLEGELRLFCSVTASYSHLPELINEFRINYPQIEIKLSTGDPAQSIDKVVNDEADIAISAKPESLPAKLSFETISNIPLSVIGPSGISGLSVDLQSTPIQWDKVPFIVPEAGTARDRANSWFKSNKIKPNIYAQVSGHEAIVSMVALGCGVGIAPNVVIESSPVKEKIQILNTSAIEPFELGICCKRSQLNNPLIKALWQLAEDKFLTK